MREVIDQEQLRLTWGITISDAFLISDLIEVAIDRHETEGETDSWLTAQEVDRLRHLWRQADIMIRMRCHGKGTLPATHSAGPGQEEVDLG